MWRLLALRGCRVDVSFASTMGLATSAATPSAIAAPANPSPAPVRVEEGQCYPYELVDTPRKLEEAVDSLQRARSVALDVEAFCQAKQTKQLGTISLVQACSDAKPFVYLFDVLTLTTPVFAAMLSPLLENPLITKLFFDCRRDVEALSCQMHLTPRGVLDLQLYFTALQWRLRGVNRRSSMAYVLRTLTGVDRKEGDSAVQTAMTVGNRPVWDVRPLPEHFLEYAAGDVRNILSMAPLLTQPNAQVSIEAVKGLSAKYVEHYAIGQPVVTEVDQTPAEVHIPWLEAFIGPGGFCQHCQARGHTEAECFKKQQGKIRCSYCRELGHSARSCFQKHPQRLKCVKCGQIGHTGDSCFKTNPCVHCGKAHHSDNCHNRNQKARNHLPFASHTAR